MVTTDTIEGIISDTLWYHFDVSNDVLYLQRVSTRGQETFGEETPDGFIVFRTEDDRIAGMTIVNWWKRFGEGELTGVTLEKLWNRVEESAHPLQAAA